MLAAHGTSGHRLQAGQKITGTVIAITGDSVFVDVGIKVDGIMERKDILDAEGKETTAPGELVEAWVVGVSAQEIRLSRSMSGSGGVRRCGSDMPVATNADQLLPQATCVQHASNVI